MPLWVKIAIGIWLYLSLGFGVYLFAVLLSAKWPDIYGDFVDEETDGAMALVYIVCWFLLLFALMVVTVIHWFDKLNNIVLKTAGLKRKDGHGKD